MRDCVWPVNSNVPGLAVVGAHDQNAVHSIVMLAVILIWGPEAACLPALPGDGHVVSVSTCRLCRCTDQRHL